MLTGLDSVFFQYDNVQLEPPARGQPRFSLHMDILRCYGTADSAGHFYLVVED